jgi:hypothetical protein
MYIHIHRYMHTHIHTAYISTYNIHTYMAMYKGRMWVQLPWQTCTYIHTHTNTQTDRHTHTHSQSYTYTQTHRQTRMCGCGWVVISGAFINFLLASQSQHKYKIIFFFSGEAKDSAIFSFYFCFIRELNPYTPLISFFRPPIHPFLHPSFHPPIPPQPTFNPSVCPVTTVERMDVEPNPKTPP